MSAPGQRLVGACQRAQTLTEDTFPEGWQLGAESWSFHRQFYLLVGRPTRQGEYKALITQIRYKRAEPLPRHYWRVKLADGTPVVVKGGWLRLLGVEAGDYVPRPRKVWLIRPLPLQPKAPGKPPEVAQPAPPARAPPQAIADPEPRQPLRASTLTLANPAAARALADRLRRAGIPAERASP
jgi:hypothetical protein